MTGPDDAEPRTRAIRQEVEVVGTPEQVWQAIATGPGITAWFVPSEVEPHVGGVVRQSFGPGEEMQVEGRVQAWEPPHRFAFGEGTDPDVGMAFEFVVEARDGGSCVVRLVNGGFLEGAEWDAQYDGMDEGWKLFLRNLQLHLELFAGRTATAVLPTAMATGGAASAWERLTDALGVDPVLEPGTRIESVGGAPVMAGEVRSAGPAMAVLVLDRPAAGTGFLVVEGTGDAVSVSVWLYLYDEAGADAAAARDEPAWAAWLADVFPPPAEDPPPG